MMFSILIVSLHMFKTLKKERLDKGGFILIVVQSRKKIIGQKQEIKQERKRQTSFDIYFSVIKITVNQISKFLIKAAMAKVLLSGRETGY